MKMHYKNISEELDKWVRSNYYLSNIHHLDIYLLFGGLALMVADYLVFNRISLFTILSRIIAPVAYYGFLLGAVLTYASFKNRMLAFGLLGYACYLFVLPLIFGGLSFGGFLGALIFGYMGYYVFRYDAAQGNT